MEEGADDEAPVSGKAWGGSILEVNERSGPQWAEAKVSAVSCTHTSKGLSQPSL